MQLSSSPRFVRIFRLLPFLALLALPACTPTQPSAPVVSLPLQDALQRARSEAKPLLVAFLGNDWSVASKQFSQNVLESPEFKTWADQHLILYVVNARRKPKLSSADLATLQSLVVHFDVTSYPTLILLDPDGSERIRHGHQPLSPAQYIQLLNDLL